MKKVKKAIIPAAGLGTRFLPATKAMPKEMLPIVDKPTIQYIVEEAIEAGIEDIIIVTGKGKRAIEDHFDYSFELELNLLERGKLDVLEMVRRSSVVEIHYIRQKEAKGLGHAIWCARNFIGNEPFAVLLGDDIVRAETPCIGQLVQQYEKYGRPIVGVGPVAPDQTQRYGIIDPSSRLDTNPRAYELRGVVEKPAPGEAPSHLGIMGRYVLTPDIFGILEYQKAGYGGEIQLTDAISQLIAKQGCLGYEFQGERFDVGEKLGYILTSVQFALQQSELKLPLLEELERIMKLERVEPRS
ncbi:UTP--glucose-1-phosphate uridylyltransferase [Paenibacillus sp. SSG-1]|uniref:UTP--glucose-1-phosphate uridylyltransferase n=1 Tax=Paenibacillus cineris TaxID=237530 RepID=A0ABQ4L8W0_9BACL|nr:MULTISPECIES: UTP--glucose-1-phosphate uridylyltransferase GalU [Paenibacillus]OXL82659.1 UTP--glucose-1-phosphate uridylyltransferase [Paenibacillus sp. SSG-1]GIO53019.1 UTP--glucose-1-phosphate uridylyltransferase [Paenibacillus cineris]